MEWKWKKIERKWKNGKKMEPKWNKMERNGKKMEKNGTEMEQNGTKMEKMEKFAHHPPCPPRNVRYLRYTPHSKGNCPYFSLFNIR